MVGLTKRRSHYGDRAELAIGRKVGGRGRSTLRVIIKGNTSLDVDYEISIVPLGRAKVGSKREVKVTR